MEYSHAVMAAVAGNSQVEGGIAVEITHRQSVHVVQTDVDGGGCQKTALTVADQQCHVAFRVVPNDKVRGAVAVEVACCEHRHPGSNAEYRRPTQVSVPVSRHEVHAAPGIAEGNVGMAVAREIANHQPRGWSQPVSNVVSKNPPPPSPSKTPAPGVPPILILVTAADKDQVKVAAFGIAEIIQVPRRNRLGSIQPGPVVEIRGIPEKRPVASATGRGLMVRAAFCWQRPPSSSVTVTRMDTTAGSGPPSSMGAWKQQTNTGRRPDRGTRIVAPITPLDGHLMGIQGTRVAEGSLIAAVPPILTNVGFTLSSVIVGETLRTTKVAVSVLVSPSSSVNSQGHRPGSLAVEPTTE